MTVQYDFVRFIPLLFIKILRFVLVFIVKVLLGFIYAMNSNSKINDEKRQLLNDLINVTREISAKYSGGKQVVTESLAEVNNLINLIEKILCFGLKSNSILGNVQELFSSTSSSNGSLFWSFAQQHLTKHEQERFSNYKNVSGNFALPPFI